MSGCNFQKYFSCWFFPSFHFENLIENQKLTGAVQRFVFLFSFISWITVLISMLMSFVWAGVFQSGTYHCQPSASAARPRDANVNPLSCLQPFRHQFTRAASGRLATLLRLRAWGSLAGGAGWTAGARCTMADVITWSLQTDSPHGAGRLQLALAQRVEWPPSGYSSVM